MSDMSDGDEAAGNENRGDEAADEQGLDAMRRRVRGTNVHEQTLLATDYLNHFNEVVMVLEMIADMPEMLEEAQAWKPLSYKDHFRKSAFSDAALAVEAYDFVPARYRKPFEQTVDQLNRLIATTVERVVADVAAGDMSLVRANAGALTQVIHRLQGVASGIIHGSVKTMDQSEVDSLLMP